MATKQEILNKVLEDLQLTSRDIQGVAIISPDGMMIANHFNIRGNDATATGAMGAAMTGLGSRVAKTLQVGKMMEINMRSEQANVLVFVVENRAALMVQVNVDANLGLILMESRKAQESLQKLL